MANLLLFCVLQALDAVTTVVFLHAGVAEANPLIRFALGFSASPLLPLALVKACGCAVAFAAWRARGGRALRAANVVFAGCVLWNLAAIACA